VTSPTQRLAPALDVDARLTEIERLEPAAQPHAGQCSRGMGDFERSDFGTVPTLRLRPLDLEPDLPSGAIRVRVYAGVDPVSKRRRIRDAPAWRPGSMERPSETSLPCVGRRKVDPAAELVNLRSTA
jgi:hypothetical protein